MADPVGPEPGRRRPSSAPVACSRSACSRLRLRSAQSVAAPAGGSTGLNSPRPPIAHGREAATRSLALSPSAARFCSAHDEARDHLLHRTSMREVVPLGVQRERFLARLVTLRALLGAP